MTRRARPPRIDPRHALAVLSVVLLALAGATGCSATGDAGTEVVGGQFDISSKNLEGRPHIDPVPEAVEALEASGFEPSEAGRLTVALGSYVPPTSFLAEDDNNTFVGSDPDLASLIAEGLGLELSTRNVAWADWPLGIESGKYDLGITNITVTEERKDLFDIATYREDVLAFAVREDSDIESISSAEDVSGLKVVVGSGTNQEKILHDWFDENEANGLSPGEAVYFEDQAAADLALASGRVDATFGPNAAASFKEVSLGETRIVGTLNGGFPDNAEIGAATAKDNGLAEPVSIVINSLIEDGRYDEVLERWATEDEAIDASRVNPPGLARP